MLAFDAVAVEWLSIYLVRRRLGSFGMAGFGIILSTHHHGPTAAPRALVRLFVARIVFILTGPLTPRQGRGRFVRNARWLVARGRGLAIDGNGGNFFGRNPSTNLGGIFAQGLTGLFVRSLISHIFPTKVPRGSQTWSLGTFQETTSTSPDNIHNLRGNLGLVTTTAGNVGGLVFGHQIFKELVPRMIRCGCSPSTQDIVFPNVINQVTPRGRLGGFFHGRRVVSTARWVRLVMRRRRSTGHGIGEVHIIGRRSATATHGRGSSMTWRRSGVIVGHALLVVGRSVVGMMRRILGGSRHAGRMRWIHGGWRWLSVVVMRRGRSSCLGWFSLPRGSSSSWVGTLLFGRRIVGITSIVVMMGMTIMRSTAAGRWWLALLRPRSSPRRRIMRLLPR
mmetsp:Transcript_21733/g.45388  ORF Transcript_21733/g.45388 Transcript_21733/m.45388 type:complete len:392 (-) Transcript_21733:800-1975(-)